MRNATVVLAACSVALTGCGSSGGCTYSAYLEVTPVNAVINSSATAPKNQQQFTAISGETAKASDGASCAVPDVVAVVYPAWINPDPLHTIISSADDQSNGLATCKSPTGGPVTLTASIGAGTSANSTTVTLTCQ